MNKPRGACRNPHCGGEPAYWVEWDIGKRSREQKPICESCSVHLKKYAERKGLSAYLHLVPLEQITFPF